MLGTRRNEPSQVKVNWQLPVVRWKTTPQTLFGNSGWRTRLTTTWATACSPASSSPASYQAALARQVVACSRSSSLPVKMNGCAAQIGPRTNGIAALSIRPVS